MDLKPTREKKQKKLSKERFKELAERRTSWGVQVPPVFLSIMVFCWNPLPATYSYNLCFRS